jgi:hypothetical protein
MRNPNNTSYAHNAEVTVFISESIARQRNAERLKEAQQERSARQVSELQKLERVRQRAERKLLSAWERSDELRSQLAL